MATCIDDLSGYDLDYAVAKALGLKVWDREPGSNRNVMIRVRKDTSYGYFPSADAIELIDGHRISIDWLDGRACASCRDKFGVPYVAWGRTASEAACRALVKSRAGVIRP